MSKEHASRSAEDFTVNADNYRSIELSDVSDAFTSVLHGHDPIAANNLIRYFHFSLLNGDLFSAVGPMLDKERVFLEFIEYAFARYVAGKSLNAAFGLERTKGQRDMPDNTLRNLAITAFVVLRMRSGINWIDAIGDAANEFFPDEKGTRACEDAYSQHNDTMHSLPNDQLEILVRSNGADLNV